MDNKLSSRSMEASLMDFVIIWKAALFPFSYKQLTRGKPGGHKVHPVEGSYCRLVSMPSMVCHCSSQSALNWGHVRQAIIAVAFASAWLSSWEYIPWRELFLRNVRKSEESWQLKAVTLSFLRQFYHSSAGTPIHKAFSPYMVKGGHLNLSKISWDSLENTRGTKEVAFLEIPNDHFLTQLNFIPTRRNRELVDLVITNGHECAGPFSRTRSAESKRMRRVNGPWHGVHAFWISHLYKSYP